MYDIKIYDTSQEDWKEKETIRNVTEAQRIVICQMLIRLGVIFKVIKLKRSEK